MKPADVCIAVPAKRSETSVLPKIAWPEDAKARGSLS